MCYIISVLPDDDGGAASAAYMNVGTPRINGIDTHAGGYFAHMLLHTNDGRCLHSRTSGTGADSLVCVRHMPTCV